MKKGLSVVLISILLISTLLFAGCSNSSSGEVIGTVNGEKIYSDEYQYYFDLFFNDYYENYYDYFIQYYGIDLLDEESAVDVISDLEGYVWETVVRSEIIRQIAKNEYNLQMDETYLNAFLGTGFAKVLQTNELYDKYFEAVRERMAADITVSDTEAEAAYNEDPTAWDCRKTSHILIKVEDPEDAEEKEKALAIANEVINKLNSGSDFADLAKEYSDDTTAESGGVVDVYFNVAGNDLEGTTSLYKEYAEAAFTLANVGDYTTTPVASEAGYHVIKLEDKKEGFAAVKDSVINSLKSVPDEDVSEEINNEITNYTEDADIEFKIEFKYYDPESSSNNTTNNNTNTNTNNTTNNN